jgi:hypothetical protein
MQAFLVIFKLKKYPHQRLSWYHTDGWRSACVRAESKEEARAIAKKALKSNGMHEDVRWVDTMVYDISKLPPGPTRGKRFEHLVREYLAKST